MASWIGCSVSINCGATLGCYQGKICKAGGNQITLTKPFRNGMPYPQPEVTLCASDIVKLTLIDIKSDPKLNQVNVGPASKPMKKNIMSVSDALSTSHTRHENNKEQPPVKGVVVNSLIIESNSASNNCKAVLTNNKSANGSIKWDKKKTKERNEECFGTSFDENLQQDFDFEKNLALFDKQAIWDKINASKPDLLRQAGDTMRRPNTKKFRHDENVIATLPASYRPIILQKQQNMDEHPCIEYVTDDGLIIPSISEEIKDLLYRMAVRAGVTLERQIEIMGRATAEISLQLLGGGHRLNPRNTHQFPTVAAFCGSGKQGAYTVNAARQLASHGVETVVYKDEWNMENVLENEHSIYRLTGHKTVSRITDLPRPDLILVGYASEENTLMDVTNIVEWINEIRVPVLALDPPSIGYEGFNTKFSMIPMLPLSYTPNNGKLYLCNLAFPDFVFTKVGIKYKSPFGSKFVIPLYTNDE